MTTTATCVQQINGSGSALVHGELVRTSAINTVTRAQADIPLHLVGFIGANGSGTIGVGGSANIFTAGAAIDVLLEPGLTVSAGQTVYISAVVAGRGTNVASVPGTITPVGTIRDTRAYARTGIVVVSLAIAAGIVSGDVAAPIEVGTFADISSLVSVNLQSGQPAIVNSANATFILLASTAAIRTNLRIPANGKAGYQWIRQLYRQPIWETQTTWVIDPTNTTGLASDDNSGLNASAPLLTYQEHAWRWAEAQITSNAAITVLGSQQIGDEPVFTARVAKNAQCTWTGTPTDIYTSTVTSFTLMNVVAAAADDAQFVDTGVPGGSFTAAGVVAKGVRLIGTTGARAIAYLLKDLGGTTCRTSRPMNGATPVASNAVFVAGDTYKAQTLPTILFFTWRDQAPWGAALNTFNINIPVSLFTNNVPPNINNCYISSMPNGQGGLYSNFCLDGTSHFFGGANVLGSQVVTSLVGGAFKTLGTIILSQSVTDSETSTLCFQGGSVLVENGTFNTGQLCFYDSTGPLIQVGTGGVIHLGAGGLAPGFVSGKGNTNRIFLALSGGQIKTNRPMTDGNSFVLASTTDPTPVQSGTKTSTGNMPAGIGGSGVFQYDLAIGAGNGGYDVNGVPTLFPIVIGKFSGGILGGAGSTISYLADTGLVPTVNFTAIRYPTLSRTVTQLSVFVTQNSMTATTTLTLYKNNAATALTLNIASGATGNFSVSNTGIGFTSGDDFSVVLSNPGDNSHTLTCAVTIEGV